MIKKFLKILTVVLCIVMAMMSTGCSKIIGGVLDKFLYKEKESIPVQPAIDPFEKITVQFSGENGKGIATIIVNGDLKESDFTVENNGSLKNDDSVKITYNVTGNYKEYTVQSLTEPKQENNAVNPFEYVDVYFSGVNGKGFAHISTMSTEFSPIYFYLEGVNGTLKNGDTVVIKFDTAQFSIYHHGYSLIKDSHTYVVSGLEGTAVDVPDNSLPYDLQVTGSANGFILPYSNVQYYDEAFLSTFTDKQLKFARNEITARHGRKFVTAELQNYFETTPWYEAKYEPTYFDNYIFDTMNQFEKGNMETIKKIEQARKAN